MNKNLTASLQLQIIDYFKKYDDKTFIQIVDAFVYNTPPIPDKKNKVSTILQEFLKENGIETAYVNYISDQRNDNKFFNRSSFSEIGIIEDIKSAMLNASFNRFRNSLRSRDASKELKELKELVQKFMSPKDTDEFDDAIDTLRSMNWVRRKDEN